MPKQEFHITDFSGGLNSYSDARDIKDTQFAQNWNASLDKYGVVRFTGAGKRYIQNHPHVNSSFVPGGGFFSYSSDYIDNIIQSDFNGGYFGGNETNNKIGSYSRGATTITLKAVGPFAAGYSALTTDDSFDDMLLHVYAGPGKGQVRTITNYAASGRTCTIDAAFGHSGQNSGSYDTNDKTIQAITGAGNQKIKAVAKIEIFNDDTDAEDANGLSYQLGNESLCSENGTFVRNSTQGSWSTLVIKDRDGGVVQCHFLKSEDMTIQNFAFDGYNTSTVKELDADYVNLSNNIFTPGDRHYLIKADDVGPAEVVDYLVVAINNADSDDVCNIVASVEPSQPNGTILALEAEGGEGIADVSYTGYWKNRLGATTSLDQMNPYNDNKTLNIFQNFTKGLGSPNKNIIAIVQADDHALNVGEWITITGGSYAGTHRVEWVYDNYFVIYSTVGTDDTTDRTFDTIPTTASYYKIYNWNTGASGRSAWHKASSEGAMLFSNKHYGNADTVLLSSVFKKEINSPGIPGYGLSNNTFHYENTFLCASGEAASAGATQNTVVDLGYIEQTGLDLRPGESYQLSFDMNCLTPWKMWTADGTGTSSTDISDILPGVLIYSPTSADGSAQDYALMADDQWIKSNEPVSTGNIDPFTNIVINGDFKANAGSTYDDQGNPTITGWTVVRSETSSEPLTYSLHENTSANHIEYRSAGGLENEDGNIVQYSGDGGKNGGTVLELASNSYMTSNLYTTNYIYQDLELDGNCWYDLYIKWETSPAVSGLQGSGYLRFSMFNQESTDEHLDNNQSLFGWKIYFYAAKLYDTQLKWFNPVYNHTFQDKANNMSDDKFRFSYHRVFIPPRATETDARTIRLKITGNFNYGGLPQQTFISAVSVKKSFPDLVHITNQLSEDEPNRPKLPVLASPQHSDDVPMAKQFNKGPFFNEWQIYKLNFTVPKDAYDTRDYKIRLYGGRFGYTSATTSGQSSTNSPYPNQQAVCIDNLKLTQKATGRGNDILLLNDNIAASTSVSYVGNIIPAQSKIHKYLVGTNAWDKEFAVWPYGDAEPVYSYTNGILQISDSNFSSDNENLFFQFYYNRPVYGDYDTDGFILTEDPVNFIENMSATEFKNTQLKSIHLHGCHEYIWRGYEASISEGVPDDFYNPPDNWHYMHFDWQVAKEAGYYKKNGGASFHNNDKQKSDMMSIPIKYVNETNHNSHDWMRKLTESAVSEEGAIGEFNLGGEGFSGGNGNPSNTLGHVYNNPVYLPILGWQDLSTYPGSMDAGHFYSVRKTDNLDAVMTTIGVEADPYYYYPAGSTGNIISGNKGGNNMTTALMVQDTNYDGRDFFNPGKEGGPLYAANMSFDLILNFRGTNWAESLGVEVGDAEANARHILDCPIPRIRATLIKLEDGVDIDTTFLDNLFTGTVSLSNEVASEILPKTSKSLRQKNEEGNDDLFNIEVSDYSDHGYHGTIPYRFQLNIPFTTVGDSSPIKSTDNIVLKLEILDPTNNINYLERFIGTDAFGNDLAEENAQVNHSLGYNFNAWNMNFYTPEYHENNLISGVSGNDIKVNLDFKVPIDADGQEIVDTSESWTDRIFQIGCSTVNIFDEESIINIDQSNDIGKTVKINIGEAPRMSVIGTDVLFHNPMVKKVNIYMKDNESDIWYLQASIDTFKGKIKSSTSGKEFDYSFKDNNVGGAAATVWDIQEKYMLNFNEVDSYESQALIRQEDALNKRTIRCRYKTSVHCNNRLYVGNVKQDGKIYGDRMLKTPIGKYNIFPAGDYIDVAIHDGDDITALAYFKDKILQFKRRKVFVINISGDYEYLEDTFDGVGVKKQCQVVTTPQGICWANSSGCFLYDGKKLNNLIANKIGTESFQSNPVGVANNYWRISSDDQPSIGYVGSTQKLIVAINVGDKNDTTSRTITSIPEAYQYDFQSKGWTFVFKKLTATQTDGAIPSKQGHLSNFVNDHNNELLYYGISASGDIASDSGASDFNAIYKWDDTSTRSQDTNNLGDMFFLRTKDYDFGSPGIRKKIYKVYVTFKTHDDTDGSDGYQHSKVNVYYNFNGVAPISGEASALTFSDSTSSNYSASNGLYASDSSTGWNVAELKPSASINNVYSFSLLFQCAPSRIANRFEINDITIVYRTKNVK